MQIKSLLKLGLVSSALLVAACSGGSNSNHNSTPAFSSNIYSFSLDEDTSFSDKVTASDPDSDSLSYTVESAASNGAFELSSNGSFTYTPNENFNGEDSVIVQVSDGTNNARADVVFTINPVNDAPVLKSSSTTVTSDGKTTGKIIVEDVDGDAITFAVVTPPKQGVLTLDPNTGEFVFSATDLEIIDSNFTISFTDSIIPEPIIASISLKSSFVTNLDKLSYYYSSNKSHIRKAENTGKKITDDVTNDQLKIELAKGYILAGFIEQAESVIESIKTTDVKGNAYRLSAEILDSQNKIHLANQYRSKALSSFNAYIAQKGLDNISSGDSSFFIALINDYNDVGETEAANDLINTLSIYAEAVREEKHNTAYGRFLTAARNNVRGLLQNYFDNRSEGNRLKAVSANDFFVSLVEKTGYMIQRRGTYAGQPVDRLKAMYMATAGEFYLWLNEEDKAKELTAKSLAIYTDANYDPKYSYPAGPYAEVTLNTYTYPIESIAGLIAALYPNLTTNPALALLEVGSRDYNDAREKMFTYEAERAILDGSTVADAVSEAERFFTNTDDLRGYANFLVEFSPDRPRLATLLINRGESALAKDVMDEALELLETDAYVLGERLLYSLGTRGCARWVVIYKQASQDTSNLIKKCRSGFDTYFQPGQGKYSIENSIDAYKSMAYVYSQLDMQSDVITLGENYKSVWALITDPMERLKFSAEAASFLASYKAPNVAQDFFNLAISEAELMLSNQTLTSDQLENIIDALYNTAYSNVQRESKYETYAYMSALRYMAHELPEYQSYITKALIDSQKVVVKINEFARTLSDNEQQDLMEKLVRLNMYVQLFDEAEAFVNSDVNPAGDLDSLNLIVGTHYALKDDFPATWVANVDIDNDGLATFFVREATEDDIAASGLEADQDSDGDGVSDTEDSTPIGEE